jgi:hypothetical protein
VAGNISGLDWNCGNQFVTGKQIANNNVGKFFSLKSDIAGSHCSKQLKSGVIFGL